MMLAALLLMSAQPVCTAEHAAMGHCKMAETPPPAPSCTPEHAAMGHCKMPDTPPPKSAAGCSPEHAAMGHCTMAQPMSPTEGSGTDLPAGNAPPPPAPPVNAANRYFDAATMTAVRDRMYVEHGGGTFTTVRFDKAEARFGEGEQGYAWEAEARIGGDIDKLAIKTEGEGLFGQRLDGGEVQALWSHAIGPYFDMQAGMRQDFGPGNSPTHAVIGIEGLAPYWFDVEGALYLSTAGDLTTRIEASYDQRITQRLILQPTAEISASFQDIPRQGLGSGLNAVELGLRLRYEIMREFAPYVGLSWERKLGQTARIARTRGEGASHPAIVAGLRFWF